MIRAGRTRKTAALVLGIVLFSYSLGFAGVYKLPLRYSLTFNHDIRHADENFYANRLETLLVKKINSSPGKEVSLKVIPFVEVRHNVARRKKERVSAGVELGFNWRDFFYLGEQLRQVWRSEPVYNRGVIKDTDMFEALSIVSLSRQLIPGKDILKGYISGEYTYDFRLGRGTRIEAIAGVLIPLGKEARLNLDWRHRDRIHADDCDTFEAGVAYNF